MQIPSDNVEYWESQIATLTERELELCHTLLDHHTSKEIAKKLNISDRTVDKHLANIYIKLGIDNKVKLALILNNLQHAEEI
jgi:DNA-binding CsgD family transcriptional regulator